jgi:hypothetical protein
VAERIRVSRLEEIPPAEWDRFQQERGGGLFAGTRWAAVCEEGLGGRAVFLGLRDPDGFIRVGMPGMILPVLGMRIYYSAYPYGGPLGDDGLKKELVRRSGDRLRSMGVHAIRINLPPGVTMHLPDYRVTSLPRHSVCLDPREAAGPRARRDAGRARRAGLRVERMCGDEGVRSFYRLYLLSMKRNRAAARTPLRLFHSLEKRLGPTGEASFRGVRRGSQVVSAICIVQSGGIAHALSQGSDPACHGDQPTDLLIDECLSEAEKAGMEAFDFMASPAGDASLIRFKEKWGGRAGEVITLDGSLHPILGPGTDLVRRLARVPLLAGAARLLRRWRP